MSTASAAPQVSVFLHVRSRCPLCQREIVRQATLTEDSLVTGNTTQMASYHVKALRAEVVSEAVERGWTNEMCGRCRDVDEEARARRDASQIRGTSTEGEGR